MKSETSKSSHGRMASRQAERSPLFALYAVVFIGTLGFSIVIPFMVFLVLRLGGNAAIYGIVGSAYSLCQLIGAPILGAWSDRFGRRRILLLSQAGTAAAWLLFLIALALPVTRLAEVESSWLGSFTLTLPLLLVFAARALDGLTGGNISVANAYLADVTDEEDRTIAFGRLAIAQNLGFVAGPALAGLLGAWGEVIPVVAALAISTAALAVIAWRLPESDPCAYVASSNPKSLRKVLGQESRDCHEVRDERRLRLSQIFSLPSVGLLLSIHFLIFLAFNFFYVALPMHGARNLGWTMPQVGLFLSFFSACMAITQGPILSRVAKKLSEQALMLIGALILIIGFGSFSVGSFEAMMLGAALVALGNGLLWPSLLAVMSKAAGERAQGAVQGVAGSSGAVAGVVGMIIGGVFFESLGALVFALSAALASVAFIATFTYRSFSKATA